MTPTPQICRPRPTIFVVLSACLAMAISSCRAPETPGGALTISGRVATATGEPPALGHIHIGPLAGMIFRINETFAIEANGEFELTLARDQTHQLVVTALHHQSLSVPLVISDDAGHVELDLTLQAQKATGAEEIRVQGDDDLEGDMVRRDDGTWSYTVEAPGDGVSYRIRVGGLAGHTVDGTQADGYEPKGSRGYSARVDAAGVPVEIVFDPTQLPRQGQDLPRLTTEDVSLSRAFGFAQALDDASKVWKDTLKRGEEVDWSQVYAGIAPDLFAALETTDSAALRGFAAAHALTLQGDTVSEDQQRLALEQLPADSPFWPLVGLGIQSLDAEAHGTLLASMHQNHADAAVRAMALGALIQDAKTTGDDERWRTLYAELQTVDAKQVPFAKFLQRRLDPNARIAVGQPIPDFELTLFDSSFQGRDTVSKADLAGRAYLIDFWGTWCAPCVAEMPHLTDAWEAYKDRGFQILSIGVEDSAAPIQAFRKDRYPMPWLHHYVEGSFKGEILKTFEVSSYPKPILVGVDGTILALEGLSGDELMATVASAMDG